MSEILEPFGNLFIIRKKRSVLNRFLRRIWLFLLLVYRIDQSESRMRPDTAWAVAGIVHDFKVPGCGISERVKHG